MIPAPLPPDEKDRVKELKNLHLLDTPAEERFDRIVRLAAKLFNMPIVMISLVDENRVWFKARQGLAVPESPREASFCGHAILAPEPMVVADTLKDERFIDNPFVKGEPFIRYYAGYPLTGPQGHRVGVLCLIDHQPREFGEDEIQLFRDLAVLAETELSVAHIHQAHQKLLEETHKLRNQALVDSLTRLWNRGAIMEIMEVEWKKSVKLGTTLAIIMADVDHYKVVNDNHGHPVGDTVLLETARVIRSCLRNSDSAGRYGGDEFLFLLPDTDLDTAVEVAHRIREALEQNLVVTNKGNLKITVSLGVGIAPNNGNSSLEAIISYIDRALYRAKQEGRNRVCQAEPEFLSVELDGT